MKSCAFLLSHSNKTLYMAIKQLLYALKGMKLFEKELNAQETSLSRAVCHHGCTIHYPWANTSVKCSACPPSIGCILIHLLCRPSHGSAVSPGAGLTCHPRGATAMSKLAHASSQAVTLPTEKQIGMVPLANAGWWLGIFFNTPCILVPSCSFLQQLSTSWENS